MLQIRDPRIDELMDRLTALRGLSKADILVEALEREWERVLRESTLEERLRPLQEFVASHPKTGLAADKTFFDDLSDE